MRYFLTRSQFNAIKGIADVRNERFIAHITDESTQPMYSYNSQTNTWEQLPVTIRDTETNQTIFVTDAGNFTLTMTWDDLRFPAQGINPAGIADAPSIDTTVFPGTLLFSSSAPNYIAGVAQLPHSWERGSSLYPHIHWAKSTSASGGVVWEWCYAIADIGGTFGAYSAWIPATEAVSTSDTANKHGIDSFPELVMTSYKESTMICWQIRRNTAATADNYAASARLFEFDFHFQSGKLGTNTQIPV